MTYPTIADVRHCVESVVRSSLKTYNQKLNTVTTVVHSLKSSSMDDDSCIITIGLAPSLNPCDDHTINIFIVQNPKTVETSVFITNSERDGFKVLYRAFNRFPIAGIQKYLPDIIMSTIKKFVDGQ